MSSLPYKKFIQNIEYIAERNVDGFVRVWGVFVDADERMVSFWRHVANSKFTFKHTETYESRTISDKIREKVSKGYEEVDIPTVEMLGDTLSRIHYDYLEARERGLFHAKSNLTP